MVVHTRSPRVVQARRLVLELLASSVDLSTAPGMAALLERVRLPAGALRLPAAATVAQPAKIDNDLYVRDYGKCVLCYKCVEACGPDHQNTFAIAVAGRGFDARISTEFDVPLPDSACVYCGNCIAVCPTGALMASREYELRQAGAWDESRQTTTDTICPYCGVGCTLHAARAGRRDRQGDVAARQRRSPRAICASRAGSAGASSTASPTYRDD